MNTWTVYSNRAGGNAYEISGETLAGAIVGNFGRIVKDAGIGNAAGYNLDSVTLLPGGEGHSVGGKPFARLRIEAHGADLAHREADATPAVTEVWIRTAEGEVTAEQAIPIGR